MVGFYDFIGNLNLFRSLLLAVPDDGEFELQKPPKPDENTSEKIADAVAESIEQAMEQKRADTEL